MGSAASCIRRTLAGICGSLRDFRSGLVKFVIMFLCKFVKMFFANS